MHVDIQHFGGFGPVPFSLSHICSSHHYCHAGQLAGNKSVHFILEII